MVYCDKINRQLKGLLRQRLPTLFYVEGFFLLNKIECNNTFHVYTSIKCQLYSILKVLFSDHYIFDYNFDIKKKVFEVSLSD